MIYTNMRIFSFVAVSSRRHRARGEGADGEVGFGQAVFARRGQQSDMPGKTGLQVIQWMQTTIETPPPVIMLTARAEYRLRLRANNAATSVPSDAAISEARANKKSPAKIACKLPHLAFTVSTPRRVGDSSITSS